MSVSCAPTTTEDAGGSDLLIENARVFDGTGAPPQERISILIRDGRIKSIETDIVAQGVRSIDVAGATVLPGLIDSHVHLFASPGAVQRGDTPETTRQLRLNHLKAYLACGVTTVLDTAMPVEDARKIRALLDAGNTAPRVLMLSPAFTTPGGYLTDARSGFVIPSVSSPAEVEQRFEETAELGGVGVKVFLESGFLPETSWPIHSVEIREAIAASAAKRDLPIYVHGGSEQEDLLGLAMGAKALVHTGFGGSRSDEFIQRLADRGTYVMTTAAILDSWFIRKEPDRLEDPLVQLVVPDQELRTARQTDAWDTLVRVIAETGLTPEAGEESIQKVIASYADRPTPDMVKHTQRVIKRMHDGGVRIVIGSDSGNWPVIPYEFHGPTTLREMELVQEAGLTPQEVILAATRVPAEMLDLIDEIGTIEVGKLADLIVVRGDPLGDVRALRQIQWTIKDGLARAPHEWMTAARE
jgi:imidazolonepropionase-like amidohydrolase